MSFRTSPACPCCQPQLRSAAHRIDQALSRRGFIAGAGTSLVSLGLFGPVAARAAVSPPRRRSCSRIFCSLMDGPKRCGEGSGS